MVIVEWVEWQVVWRSSVAALAAAWMRPRSWVALRGVGLVVEAVDGLVPLYPHARGLVARVSAVTGNICPVESFS